jgi:hypothetical protein
LKRFDSADRSGSTTTTGEKAGIYIETCVALRMRTKVAWNANPGPGLFQRIHLVSVLQKKINEIKFVDPEYDDQGQ